MPPTAHEAVVGKVVKVVAVQVVVLPSEVEKDAIVVVESWMVVVKVSKVSKVVILVVAKGRAVILLLVVNMMAMRKRSRRRWLRRDGLIGM